jgi:hypothetical protein
MGTERLGGRRTVRAGKESRGEQGTRDVVSAPPARRAGARGESRYVRERRGAGPRSDPTQLVVGWIFGGEHDQQREASVRPRRVDGRGDERRTGIGQEHDKAQRQRYPVPRQAHEQAPGLLYAHGSSFLAAPLHRNARPLREAPTSPSTSIDKKPQAWGA